MRLKTSVGRKKIKNDASQALWLNAEKFASQKSAAADEQDGQNVVGKRGT